MCGTSANKSSHQKTTSLSTAEVSNRRSMITTGPLKQQRSWVWCQTKCLISRQDSLPLTKIYSRLAKSQRSNLTPNQWEFSSEPMVTLAWSQITHETRTKGTNTLKTGNHQSSLTITFRCMDSNDSLGARSPHKVWWCLTVCREFKSHKATLEANTPSVKLHLRKLL